MAKTFTNRRTGQVMPVLGKKKVVARKAPVNPLDAAVNSAIGSKVAPLTGMLDERNKQYAAEQQYGQQSDAALQSELTKIGGDYNTAKSQALGSVAAGQALGQDEQARANSFLQSVLGGMWTDQPGAASAQASNQQTASAPANLANRTLAGQLALEQTAGNSSLALQKSAALQAGQEWQRSRSDANSADGRTLQAQIAAIRAQAPDIRRKYATEDEQMRLARDQLNQNQSQFDSTQTFQGQQADLDRTAAATAAGTKAGVDNTEKTDTFLGQLNSAMTDVGTLLANKDTPDGQAGSPLAKLGLKVGTDFIAKGHGGIALTPAGAIRYFAQIANLPPADAMAAIRRYDPALAKGINVVRKKGGGWKLVPLTVKPTAAKPKAPTSTSSSGGTRTAAP